MFCSNCGSQIDDKQKFCPRCGKRQITGEAPVDQAPITQPISATAVQTAAPPPPVTTAVATGTTAAGNNKWIWIVASVVAGLLVLTGVVIGIVFLVRGGGSKLQAQINDIQVLNEDDEEVDIGEVPVGEELLLVVEYNARFPKNGEGLMELRLEDSKGKKIFKKKVELKSSKELQEYEHDFELTDNMTGIKAKLLSSIKVESGSEKLDDSDKLSMIVEGQLKEETTGGENTPEVQTARQQASERIQAANNAVAELAGMGIDTSGLVELLDKANFLLANGSTVEELVGTSNSAAFYAQAVLNECNTRKQAVAQQNNQQKQRPVDNREWIVCPTCGGFGVVYYEVPEYYWETCPVCYGDGGYYGDDGVWYTCETCGGEGGYDVQVNANASEICPSCGGSGWILSMIDGHLFLAKYCPHENTLHKVMLF